MKLFWSLGCCLFIAACAGTQSVLDPAADQSRSLFDMLLLLIIVGGVMYALVIGFLTLGLHRKPAFEDDKPVIDPPDRGLGRALIAWGTVIIAALTVLVTASFLLDRHLAAGRSQESLVIRITAQQWWWRIAYRDPTSGAWIETANELHLPVGRTVRVELMSNDVIHSFWIPNIAGKMDVIPGRTNRIDLTPTRTGWFRGQCAEFCGQQHAHMAFDVAVESQARFDAWLANQARGVTAASDPVSLRAMQVIGLRCASCHTLRGTAAAGRAGPDLTHLASRRRIAAGTIAFSRDGVQGWIAQPQAIKPGTLMPATPLDAADADAVARYLETLR